MFTAYLEGTMADEDRGRFETHLAECPFCTEYVTQMRATIGTLGRIDQRTISPASRAELLAAFRGLGR